MSSSIPKRGSSNKAKDPAEATSTDYVPLPLLGQIREKGFAAATTSSSSSFSSSIKHRRHVSVPEPRITPFPVARHRSEGPHWAPTPSNAVEGSFELQDDADDMNGQHLASKAEPLVRKKKNVIDFSKRRAESGQKCQSTAIEASANKKDNTCIQSNTIPTKNNYQSSEDDFTVTQMTPHSKIDTDMADVAYEEPTNHSLAIDSMPQSIVVEREKFINAHGQADDFSATNELTLESMTVQQIAEAQQELSGRFRTDILEMLRKRGKKKAESQINQKEKPETLHEKTSFRETRQTMDESDHEACLAGVGSSEMGANGRMQGSSMEASGLRGSDMEVSVLGSQRSRRAHQQQGERNSWTERVEAIRFFRFGLDGNLVSAGFTTPSSTTGDKDRQSPVFSVTERDFLRMEGDPSSVGYTVKEAVALARSMVPAQRSAGLRLLGNILSHALLSLQSASSSVETVYSAPMLITTQDVDWQAVWAYALGPEPDLVLTLRMALDDSHATAVVTCARTLEMLLSCPVNERYFDLCELSWPGEGFLFTASIFRKPLFQESGLMGDCYWKYNVKPSDMFPFSKSGKPQGDDTDVTVKDDASVANQDVAAGLIRMGILPRIRYLLEVERLTAAEDSLFAILIALSRHSPAAADAVMRCPRLIDTIQQLFVADETLTWPARPTAIRLLKVLSIARRSNCLRFFDMGIFDASLRGLLREGLTAGMSRTLEGSSLAELVESLGFWRVCIKHGLGVSCFSDLYPALLFWIAPPSRWPLGDDETRDLKLASLAEPSYYLLEALASTLPFLHGTQEGNLSISGMSAEGEDCWSWKFAIPVVESSLGWLTIEFTRSFRHILEQGGDGGHSSSRGTGGLFRIMSAVVHFLCTVLERVSQKGNSGSSWLPTIVPRLGLQLVRSGLILFSGNGVRPPWADTSLVEYYLQIKQTALADHVLDVMKCLHGLVRLLKVLDCLLASVKVDGLSSFATHLDGQFGPEKILRSGTLLSSKDELLVLMRGIGSDVIEKCGALKTLDASKRGGPAPGVGVGWGSQRGVPWSPKVLVAQVELVLVVELMELFFSHKMFGSLSAAQDVVTQDLLRLDWRVQVGFSVSLLAEPHNMGLVERVFSGILLDESSIRLYLTMASLLMRKWLFKLESDDRVGEMEAYLNALISKVEDIKSTLFDHVRSVWLHRKVKAGTHKKRAKELESSQNVSTLASVPEDSIVFSVSDDKESLAMEWTGQKLPLLSFWFLSPLLSNQGLDSITASEEGDVVRHGLVLLFGMEALMEQAPQLRFHVPTAQKIHALSNVFVMSDDLFLEKGVRSMIGALQEMYVNQLNSQEDSSDKSTENVDTAELRTVDGKDRREIVQILDFESLVGQRYPSFVDRLTRQFASVSYGDLIFGRQVTIYLRRDVPDSLRLRLWKSLESERMLEFLPPLEKCCGPSTAYLYPPEDNQEILKAYASAWASGALDRARVRNSVSFSLAVFNVASFIFNTEEDDQLRKSFSKNLLLRLASRSHFQESLQELLMQQGVEGHFSCDEVKLRCAYLEEVCVQYPNLVAQIQEGNRP